MITSIARSNNALLSFTGSIILLCMLVMAGGCLQKYPVEAGVYVPDTEDVVKASVSAYGRYSEIVNTETLSDLLADIKDAEYIKSPVRGGETAPGGVVFTIVLYYQDGRTLELTYPFITKDNTTFESDENKIAAFDAYLK